MPIRALPQRPTTLALDAPRAATLPLGGGELVFVVRNAGAAPAMDVEVVVDLQGDVLIVGSDVAWQRDATGSVARLLVGALDPSSGFEVALPLFRSRRIGVGAPAARVALSISVRSANAPAVARQVTVDVPEGVAGAAHPGRNTVFS